MRVPPQLVDRHPKLVDNVTELEEGYTDRLFDLAGVLARIFV